jgi:DNA repair protein RecN (Recombination protein N)
MDLDGTPVCPDGAEVPEFLFSANPGQVAARLSSVASGGEMSRVSLALKLALASTSDVSTMVFDEIDAGIGGETAHALADSLFRASGHGRQVIVITHLAIVASRASTHLAVSKSTDDGSPVTEVTALSGSGRIEELTRILGGGDAARDHALDLLSQPGNS